MSSTTCPVGWVVRQNESNKLSHLSFIQSHYLSGWVGGGLNDNNAILNSVDVEVGVGVELGNT